MNKNVVAIIPARYMSSRFPGKPLIPILGKPMIQWVYERVSEVKQITRIYVATDDMRIYNTVIGFGGYAIITSSKHQSGTDRLAEAVTKIESNIDIVINVQGDEPIIKAAMIQQLIDTFEDNSIYMATLKKRISNNYEIEGSNVVKVVTDKDNYAIYFSRNAIPFNRDGIEKVNYFKHIGIYGYTKDFLLTLSTLQQTPLEKAEKLEQLRVLENGYKIKVNETIHETMGVDLPEHVHRVEEMLKEERGIF